MRFRVLSSAMSKERLRSDVPLAALPVPAIHRASPRNRTVRRSGAETVRDALGPMAPDVELFCLTNGQFSMIDVLEHVLFHTGRADIDLATWTAADGDIRRAHAFLLDGRVSRFRMIVDPSFRSRKPEFCATLTELFGPDALRTIPLHGKFSTVRAPGWDIAIRSSMNLNPDRRVESVEISGDAALCDMLTGFVDEVFARSPDANFTSQSPSLMPTSAPKSGLAF